MSEKNPSELSRVLSLDETTIAAPEIANCLNVFMDENVERKLQADFINLSLGDQIDQACWILASDGDKINGPTNMQRAVGLRTMHALYSLERYLKAEQPQAKWDYWLAVYENSFWQSVDDNLQKNIIKLAHERYGLDVEPVEIEPPVVGEANRTMSICEIADTKISKVISFGACRKLVNVVYIAEPVNLAAAV